MMNRFEEVLSKIREVKTPTPAQGESPEPLVIQYQAVMPLPVERIVFVKAVSLPRPRLPRRRAIKKS